MNPHNDLKGVENSFEFNVSPEDSIFIERMFKGKTRRDLDIEKLSVPLKPVWLNGVIRMIRYYQRNLSGKLGNRCVYDPSCSHYAEMAFREKGFFKGIKLTIQRLYRCRPKNGGIDELP